MIETLILVGMGIGAVVGHFVAGAITPAVSLDEPRITGCWRARRFELDCWPRCRGLVARQLGRGDYCPFNRRVMREGP
jgi:hypothetical protein